MLVLSYWGPKSAQPIDVHIGNMNKETIAKRTKELFYRSGFPKDYDVHILFDGYGWAYVGTHTAKGWKWNEKFFENNKYFLKKQ